MSDMDLGSYVLMVAVPLCLMALWHLARGTYARVNPQN